MREKELLEVLAKALVDHPDPDQVFVTKVQGEKSAGYPGSRRSKKRYRG